MTTQQTTIYTKSQVRAAILKAADHIERNPHSLDHCNCISYHLNQGSGVCMMMHVGVQLGMTGDFTAVDATIACGMRIGPDEANDLPMIEFVTQQRPRDFRAVRNNGKLLAPLMREFAEKFYPDDTNIYDLIPLADWIADAQRAGELVTDVESGVGA